MIAVVAILIAGAILFGAGAGVFLMIIISIHTVDHSQRLTCNPRNPVDATTRRILGARGHMPSRHDKKS